MQNETNTPLPEGLETQLKDLQTRHARHQAMLEEHRERKYRRREDHKRRLHRIKVIPIQMI